MVHGLMVKLIVLMEQQQPVSQVVLTHLLIAEVMLLQDHGVKTLMVKYSLQKDGFHTEVPMV
jgi:hypothetical protein